MKKSVVITGASKGIGLALSNQFLKRGHSVYGTSRSGIIDKIKDPHFSAYKLDLSGLESINQFANELQTSNIKVDLLINNAGIGPDLYSDHPAQPSFDTTFDVNMKGLVFLTEKLIPIIQERGKILNVSSKMGSIESCVNFDSVAYRMSKSAVNMYTKILSNRLDKIDVAAIHPGWVKTTIANDKKEGRLTPEESAIRMLSYIENRFADGDFWDVEREMLINW